MKLVDAEGNGVDHFTLQGPPLSTGRGTLTVAPGAGIYFLSDLRSGRFEHKVMRNREVRSGLDASEPDPSLDLTARANASPYRLVCSLE